MKRCVLFQLFKQCFKLETSILELYLDLNYGHIKSHLTYEKYIFSFICWSAGGGFSKR